MPIFSRLVFIIVIGIFCHQYVRADESIGETHCADPDTQQVDWVITTPLAAGLNESHLCQFFNTINKDKINLHSVLIERHGQLLTELYRTGPDQPINKWMGAMNPFSGDTQFGVDSLHDMRSISKSIVSLLIGIALQQGRIASLDQSVLSFYPEWTELQKADRQQISVRHLLNMNSGLDWCEPSFTKNPVSSIWNDEANLLWRYSPSHYVLSRPLVMVPGTTFHYNGGGTTVLADILVRTSGLSLSELVKRDLFEPLGIKNWQWATDFREREIPFAGLRLRPRDLLKIGRLLLNHGRWHDQQIVSVALLEEMLQPVMHSDFYSPPEAKEDWQYGYQWWFGKLPFHGRQLDWVGAIGNGGQQLVIVPDLDMSVTLTAGDYGTARILHFENQLLTQILSTVH